VKRTVAARSKKLMTKMVLNETKEVMFITKKGKKRGFFFEMLKDIYHKDKKEKG
jgi:hypothetical protein